MHKEPSVSPLAPPPASGMRSAASKLAVIPLAVAYLAVPLGAVLTRLMGPGPDPSPFLPWVLLAGLGSVWAILFRRSRVPVKKRFLFEALMFLVLGFLLFYRQETFISQLSDLVPLAMEGSPIIILGFCWLWTMTFPVPDRSAFQRYGAALGVLCVIDLACEIWLYGTAPTVRWIGNCDMLAGLLLVSLCASLQPGENDGGAHEPDQGRPAWRILILLGLAACLSRTGLFGAAWIFLCFGRGSRTVRALASILFFLLIGATFLLPPTHSDAVRYIDYWLWAKSLALFAQEPSLLLAGLPIGSALPFSIPMELSTAWEQITRSPAAMGVYLPQVQSFWLRIILGWGAIIPLVGLSVLLVFLFRRLTRMGAGLVAALFAQGMSTPLLYDPAIGAVIGLALLLALSSPEQPSEQETNAEPPAPKPKPEPAAETDPAREWDMRPL